MKRYLKELEDIRSQRDKNRYEIINRETVIINYNKEQNDEIPRFARLNGLDIERDAKL